MTRTLITLTLLTGLAAMSGCSSTPQQIGANVDTERMAAVEQAALRAGVRVVWLHPPEKTRQ